MHIVLWDTRHGGAYKDFAGGYGVGTFQGTGLRGRLIEHYYRHDYRSVSLLYGYLAAIFRQQGHTVEYALDTFPQGDVYVFNPALMTLPYELRQIQKLTAERPDVRALAVGQTANSLTAAYASLRCQVLRGEAEQLCWQLDSVLSSTESVINLGSVADLDALPFPDWSPFPHKKFGVRYDFSQFPTAYIQSSRGCTLSCNYCPYIIVENRVRARSAERVVDEVRHNIKTYGFRSFKFRDPLFAAKKKTALDLVTELGKLPKKIEFSVESRIELLTPELLQSLREVGLTSVTVGIETPSRDTLLKYKRAPIRDDKQNAFVEMCRNLGVRVIAGFMIGFPEDTEESIRGVLKYAKRVNPFAANFNICTPYPGTEFAEQISSQIAEHDFSRYDVYTPNLKYEHLTPARVTELHQKCFQSYYFRWRYLAANWRFHWPWLARGADAVQGAMRACFGGGTAKATGGARSSTAQEGSTGTPAESQLCATGTAPIAAGQVASTVVLGGASGAGANAGPHLPLVQLATVGGHRSRLGGQGPAPHFAKAPAPLQTDDATA